MTSSQLSAWLMLVPGGLWTGGILIFAVERTNLWRRMPLEQYVVDVRRSLRRADPMLPIFGAIGGAGTLWFALDGSAGGARTLAWIGAALIVLVMISSIVIAEPINTRFRRLPEGTAPERAERYRTIWRRFHFVRTVLALAAFACVSAAAVA
ncbi:DUF1772 domain-containing protein [Amycolatopsis nigrescens]|uniref:DUF1772 domain-containing protein n=1 Tax=Amycolatopsis nigrescens TaxID=381445 RepID=UPI00035E381D|nr:DUF1772 domain-containing protein [Amycolatopsis nigrescens]